MLLATLCKRSAELTSGRGVCGCDDPTLVYVFFLNCDVGVLRWWLYVSQSSSFGLLVLAPLHPGESRPVGVAFLRFLGGT